MPVSSASEYTARTSSSGEGGITTTVATTTPTDAGLPV